MADKFQPEDDRKESEKRFSDTKAKSPKNVCQIGKIGQGLVIYVEDYVKTFATQLAEEDCFNRCIAVLVGEYRTNGKERSVYLYGLVKVDFGTEQFGEFKENVWTLIYEDIKKYFSSSEIVGWYYGGTGLGKEDLNQLRSIHMENFSGRDKVMLAYDSLEKEFDFYLFDGTEFVLQTGYYVYYERNPEMQDYMIDHKMVKREEEIRTDDIAVRRMKTILEQKKAPASPVREQRSIIHLTYVAGTLMMAVLVIVTLTVMSNNRKMKEIEKSVSTLSNIFDKEESAGQDKKTSPTPALTQEITEPPTKVPTESPTKAPTEAPTAAPTPAITEQLEETPVINKESLIEYVVMPGDTLASICAKQCGNAKLVSAVKELNEIENEDLIYTGQKILLPKRTE